MDKRHHDSFTAKAEATQRRAERERLQRESTDREHKRRLQLRIARQVHDEAFAKPLISSDLLSDDERKAIRDRIRNRGRWHSMFGGKGSVA